MSYQALVISHSYSGNTRRVADQAAKTLHNMGWDVRQSSLMEAVNDMSVKKPDFIVLGTPVFYWSIPMSARKLIRKLPKFNGAKAFVFTTYGGCVTVDVPYQLALEMTSLGAEVVGGASILSPHSSPTREGKRAGDTMPDHGMGQPDEGVLDAFNKAICTLGKRIQENRVGDFDIHRLKISNARGWARAMESLFIPYRMKLKFMPRVKVDPSSCQTCGICERGCDTESIAVSEGGGVSINQKTCGICYSCVLHCPSRAFKINWKHADVLLWLMARCRKNTDTEIVY